VQDKSNGYEAIAEHFSRAFDAVCC